MAATSISSSATTNATPTAVGMMKIRRWSRRTLDAGGMRRSSQRSRKRGRNLMLRTPDKLRTCPSERRHLAQQPVHQRATAMAGGVAALAQTMADHRGQHRLHVFRYHIVAAVYECPGARRGQQGQAGAR